MNNTNNSSSSSRRQRHQQQRRRQRRRFNQFHHHLVLLRLLFFICMIRTVHLFNLNYSSYYNKTTMSKATTTTASVSSSNNNNKMIIIRIRSNVGTWKVHTTSQTTLEEMIMSSEEGTATKFQRYIITKPFSFDPDGKKLIELTTQSFQQQGLDHGSMIYCRLEEKKDGDNDTTHVATIEKSSAAETTSSTMKQPAAAAATGNNEKVLPPSKASAARTRPSSANNKKNEVVELLDSSDDDDDDDDEDDSKLPSSAAKNLRQTITSSSSSGGGGTNEDDAIVLSDSDDGDDDDDLNCLLPSSASTAESKNMNDKKRKSDSSNEQQQTQRKKQRSQSQSTTVVETTTTSKRTKTTAAATAKASSETVASIPPKKFQIVSYNIWFGPNDPSVNGLYPRERMTAIVNAIQQQQQQSNNNPLLFMGFQEVTIQLRSYLEPLLKQLGYKFCTQPNIGGFYGVGLALPLTTQIEETKFIPYEYSAQGRGLLYVKTRHILFATTHLESFISNDNDGSRQREQQILEAVNFCQQQLYRNTDLKIVIIAGDFNYDDERVVRNSKKSTTSGGPPNRPLMNLLSNDWSDAGKSFDYTYDSKENPMLGGNLRRRFDRCIYMSKKKGQNSSSSSYTYYHATSLTKIGKEPIVPNLTWNKLNPWTKTRKQVPVAPSDHFGIVVNFERKDV